MADNPYAAMVQDNPYAQFVQTQPQAPPGRMAQLRALSQQFDAQHPETAVPPLTLGNVANLAKNVGAGIVGGIAGMPGDVESLLRWASRKGGAVSQNNMLPTSSQVQDSIAGQAQNPGETMERFAGGLFAPAVAGGVINGVRGAVSSMAARTTPADVQAKNLLLRSLSRDNVSPENAADTISQFGSKPAAVVDVGGTNTARLARTVNTLPGEGSDTVSGFLADRQADQGGRVAADITQNLAQGQSPYLVTKALEAKAAQDASPLYRQAFAANQNIVSPVLDRVLETPAGKSALSTAREMMQNDMARLGVPDTELAEQMREAGQIPPTGGVSSGLKLRTWDYVKQALDDQVGSAIRAGNDNQVRILSGLRNKLVDELDAADITARAGPNSTKAAGGLYAQARAAYGGPARMAEVVQQAQDFLKLSPEELADTVGNLSPNEQAFYRAAAARVLQDRVTGAADNADVVKRIFGNKNIRAQIGAVFGKDAANNFAFAMTPEKVATMTNQFVRGGSNTANKLADVEDTGNQFAQDAATGFLHGGPQGAVIRPLMNQAQSRIGAFFNGMSPEVRAQLGNLLTQTGPEAHSLLSGLANSGQSAIGVGNANVAGFSSVLNSPVFRAMLARQAISLPPVLFGRQQAAQ